MLEKENLLKLKSYSFAIHIVGVYKEIIKEQKEFVLT